MKAFFLKSPFRAFAAGAACAGMGFLPYGGEVLLPFLFLVCAFFARGRSVQIAAAVGFGVTAAVGRMVFPQIYPKTILLPVFTAFFFVIFFLESWKRRHQEKQADFKNALEKDRRELEAWENALEVLKQNNHYLNRRLKTLESLYAFMQEAGAPLSVNETLFLCKERLDSLFSLEHFVLVLADEENRALSVQISSGCDEGFLAGWATDGSGRALAEKLLRQGKSLFVRRDRKDALGVFLRSLGVSDFIFIPFATRARAIGFFCTYSSKTGVFSGELFEELEIFCRQVAIALRKAKVYEEVQRLSITDGLTRLYSFRYFRKRLEEEWESAGRYHSPLALILLDIDHFKRYNDTYGHLAGDHVLVEVAGVLRREAAEHLCARYGGEEMVVLAPELPKDKALALAERLRAAIEALPVAVGGRHTRVTVSVGVAVFPEDASTPVQLIEAADKALYQAKAEGRNRVVAAKKS